MSWELTELARRMAQMIRFGTVQSVDASDPTQPRCVVVSGALSTPPIPWIAPRAGNDAEFWCPDVGEQAMVLSPFGDPAQAIAVLGIFQTAFPAPGSNPDVRVTKYKDGAVEQYDRAGHAYLLNVPAGGSITLQVGGVSLVLTDSGLALNGVGMAVTGGDVVADGINLKTHVHDGVQTGSEQTGAPVG